MIKKAIEYIGHTINNRRMNIHQRVLRLVLAGGMLTFFSLGALTLCGVFVTRDMVREQSEKLGESASDYMGEFVQRQTKEQLAEIAGTRATHIESELARIAEDVKFLADGMNIILSSPQNYQPRTLPDPRFQPIHSGEAYLHYGPALQKNLDAAAENEAKLLANAADYLVPLARLYDRYESSVTIGSARGFLICVDNTMNESRIVEMTPEFLANYDVVQRPWYQKAKNARVPVFTDLYVGADGAPSLTCALPYYSANGFAGVVGIGGSLGSLSRLVHDTAVGKTGFSFVLNQAGEVVLSARGEGILAADASHRDVRRSKDYALAAAAEAMADGDSGVMLVTVDDEEYYLAFAPMPSLGWSFGTAVGKAEVIAPAQEATTNLRQQMQSFDETMRAVFTKLLLGAVAIACVILFALVLGSDKVSRRFVKPIHELSDGVREIAGGNLEKKLDIKTGDEIEHLATCFNAMTDELQRYMKNLTKITAEKERIATELSVATNIQESMLPNIFPPFPERNDFDIYATMHAAKEVGGDFYDFYLLDENHVIVTIADVSGKGVPAALFMVIAKTILKNFALTMTGGDDLAPLVSCTNEQLCQNNDAMMFVTAFVGMLDIRTGRFVYVNAGHNPPLVYRAADDTFSYLSVKRNFVLGGMEGVAYKGQEIALSPGDILFLYTDGVTEALNENDEQYGENRLKECLNRREAKNIPLKELLAVVKKSLAAHVGTAEQSDDITMLALSYIGQEANESK